MMHGMGASTRKVGLSLSDIAAELATTAAARASEREATEVSVSAWVSRAIVAQALAENPPTTQACDTEAAAAALDELDQEYSRLDELRRQAGPAGGARRAA